MKTNCTQSHREYVSDDLRITITPNGVCRTGESNYISRESTIQNWPSQLQHFAPKVLDNSQANKADSILSRIEENMGAAHSHPESLILQWMKARSDLWTTLPAQEKTLLKWLKSIEPAVKISASSLVKRWKEAKVSLPFSINRADVKRALDRPLKIQLKQGYVHGRLLPRRVREKGFICWRYARENGYRGEDCAAFIAPEGQPLDIQLHILKWAWKHDPALVAQCLIAMNIVQPKIKETKISFSAHPAIQPAQLAAILGCPPGIVPSPVAGRAMTRASKLQLGSQPITVSCIPAVPKRKDPSFFLPRNRSNSDLFSLWNKGIKVDKQGRYSLTPEKIALQIASELKHSVVLDAFCGCGGNTIAFARQPHINRVIAIDNNQHRLEMAQHNAALYGVASKVSFHCTDALSCTTDAPFVFADPPWEKGMDFLQHCLEKLQAHYPSGIIKLPIDYPFPSDSQVTIILTKESYPSFALLHW